MALAKGDLRACNFRANETTQGSFDLFHYRLAVCLSPVRLCTEYRD